VPTATLIRLHGGRQLRLHQFKKCLAHLAFERVLYRLFPYLVLGPEYWLLFAVLVFLGVFVFRPADLNIVSLELHDELADEGETFQILLVGAIVSRIGSEFTQLAHLLRFAKGFDHVHHGD